MSVLVAIVSVLPTFVVQEDAASVKQLAGVSKKEWVFKEFAQFISRTPAGCIQGESWEFHSDGKLVITKCESGKIVTAEKRWSLRRKSPLDVALTIDGTEYLLLFPTVRKPKEKMILRIKSDEKVGTTKDLVFSR
jgi:hypothetical protein